MQARPRRRRARRSRAIRARTSCSRARAACSRIPTARGDINASGNPALATAGTGDVLPGMLGALLAQGIDAQDALRIAVCLHGAAADALVARGVGPLGVTASELADAARELVNGAR